MAINFPPLPATVKNTNYNNIVPMDVYIPFKTPLQVNDYM